MLKLINENKKNEIITYCFERFGLKRQNLKSYQWYEGSKNRIFIGPEKIKRINPESLGLCIFRLDKTPKPTTNFVQLFGEKINKNYVALSKTEAVKICRGNNLRKKINAEPGFVALKYNDISLGCAHWNGKIIKNQIPKSKYCNINFL
tara:strand:+ start:955 stop:1398 length:444 start_codon:yes stop_codon:yes gene_type:complete